jgi:hypothetical protein
LRNLGVEGKFKKCILKELAEMMWSGFMRLNEGTIDRLM